MSRSTRPLPFEIAQAAILHAAGLDWDRIAGELGRSAARIRRWPREFNDSWKLIYLFAQLRFVLEAALEAERVLRNLADFPEGPTRRLAQAELSRFRALREQPPPQTVAELPLILPTTRPVGELDDDPPDSSDSESQSRLDSLFHYLFNDYINNFLDRERERANSDPKSWNPRYIGFHYE
jgi:hypothetical protein